MTMMLTPTLNQALLAKDADGVGALLSEPPYSQLLYYDRVALAEDIFKLLPGELDASYEKVLEIVLQRVLQLPWRERDICIWQEEDEGEVFYRFNRLGTKSLSIKRCQVFLTVIALEYLGFSARQIHRAMCAADVLRLTAHDTRILLHLALVAYHRVFVETGLRKMGDNAVLWHSEEYKADHIAKTLYQCGYSRGQVYRMLCHLTELPQQDEFGVDRVLDSTDSMQSYARAASETYVALRTDKQIRIFVEKLGKQGYCDLSEKTLGRAVLPVAPVAPSKDPEATAILGSLWDYMTSSEKKSMVAATRPKPIALKS